jgi:hypothetical protein
LKVRYHPADHFHPMHTLGLSQPQHNNIAGVDLIKTTTDSEDQFEIKLIKYFQSEEGREYLRKLANEKLIISLLLIPELFFLLLVFSMKPVIFV